ncbi:tRNA (guanine(10)-N(2))-dimethyltransferase [Candidatus Woesearchaeota archaeon]|nr:tRNA (guanine(10)-N(2))-dimethyltransferase [Candidatus Woesearchaeota archaeon]
MDIITEGKAKIMAANSGKISKKMGVFYNTAMKLNRDISILLLNSIPKKKLQIADPLAATGIRSIRMIIELEKGKMDNISINDYSKNAISAVKKNLKLNKIRIDSRTKITAKDANIFLLESTGFDYIDIDPYGYPGSFMDSASQRISREGVIAVTATDTAALCGSSPGACQRKYWARPMRNEFMHETGLRIMIRRLQLSAMQHEKALIPVLSYGYQHYFRTFLRCKKGREAASNMHKEHGYISYCRKCLNREKSELPINKCPSCGSKMDYAGPLWTGMMNDKAMADKMLKKESLRILETIREEAGIKEPWSYNINIICSKYSLRRPPKMETVISRLREKGFRASRTHLDPGGIKTDAQIKDILESFKNVQGQRRGE